MKALKMLGNGKVEVVDVGNPRPDRPGDVLVRLRASALCGSEMHGFRGPDSMDTNFGHEAAGVVEEVNGHPWVNPGDRVALFALNTCGVCRHCRAGEYILCVNPPAAEHPGWHGEYAVVPGHQCMRLPDDIDFEVGAMLADAIGLPYRAAKRIRLSGFDEALVTGLGPIGATAAAVCRMAGARVIAVEPSPYRRDLGAKLAVEETFAPGPEVVDAVRDRTGGRMLTAALECSGTEDGLNRCISCLGVHGRLGILGENSRATINPSDAFIRRELTAAGVWYYGAGDFEDMVDLVRRGLPTDALITHRFPLEQAQEAYELMDQKQTGKVIFTRE